MHVNVAHFSQEEANIGGCLIYMNEVIDLAEPDACAGGSRTLTRVSFAMSIACGVTVTESSAYVPISSPGCIVGCFARK
jgi:hypothetical protein